MKTLLNTENQFSGKLDVTERVEGPCDIVTEKDVENTLCCMKTEKAAESSGITADLLKFMIVSTRIVSTLRNVANGLIA